MHAFHFYFNWGITDILSYAPIVILEPEEFSVCRCHLTTTQLRVRSISIIPATSLGPLCSYSCPQSSSLFWLMEVIPLSISQIPASKSSRSNYTCSTKTKSQDKNNAFNGVGDPVIPPNWCLSCSECKRETQICCSFCRSLFMWLFGVWAACAIDCVSHIYRF